MQIVSDGSLQEMSVGVYEVISAMRVIEENGKGD